MRVDRLRLMDAIEQVDLIRAYSTAERLLSPEGARS